MNKPLNLDVLMARLVLGVATPEESEAVVELYGDGDPSAVENRLPAPEQAAWTLLESHIGAIAHGTVSPQLGLGLLIDEVFRSPELRSRPGRPMGETHNAERLVALQDDYDDVRRSQRVSASAIVQTPQTDAQVVLAAREWMARNATGRV